VRLDDLLNFYGLLFARILSGEDAKASPYSRYYIAAKNPITWKEIATVFGETLNRIGKLSDGTPKSLTAKDIKGLPDLSVFRTFTVNCFAHLTFSLPPPLPELSDTLCGIKMSRRIVR
jgi:hypothetical protein